MEKKNRDLLTEMLQEADITSAAEWFEERGIDWQEAISFGKTVARGTLFALRQKEKSLPDEDKMAMTAIHGFICGWLMHAGRLLEDKE